MKIQQIKNGQYFISLPRLLVRAKGWKKGDELKAVVDSDGELKILKKKV